MPEHTIKPYWSTKYKVMTKESIDWTGIGKVMGRVPIDCRNKHKRILESRMKKGAFRRDEDDLIRRRVK